MMHTIISVIAFLFALALLITIHEFGHFIIAKMVKVKVLRFSIGFGRKLLSWHDRSGTEYQIAVFPLGGFVKMLDETEGEVPKDQLQYTFNRKHPVKKMLIVFAGPFSNLCIAFFLLWLMFVIGVSGIVPIIGHVEKTSVAYSAGLRENQKIIAVDDHVTLTWHEVINRMLHRVGDTGYLKLRVLKKNQKTFTALLPLQYWKIDIEKINVLGSLGLQPKKPPIPAVIYQVLHHSPAEKVGLVPGDKIVSINGKKVDSFDQFVEQIQKLADQKVQLLVVRAEKHKMMTTVVPASKRDDEGKLIGYIGVFSEPLKWPPDMQYVHQYSLLGAIEPAFFETLTMSKMTVMMMWRMLSGKLSWRYIGGPISIAKGVGVSVRYGFAYFLRFLALISVSLGIINLLPIPVLDGGYLVYHVAELIGGRPLSPRIQTIGIRIGLFFLILLMTLALFNDLTRLL